MQINLYLQVRNTKDCHSHQKLETEARKDSFLESLREHGPTDTFVFSF